MKSKIYIIMFSCFMLKLGNVGTKDSYIEPPEIEKTYDGNKLK
ncbi:hypothetical protein [Mycoplasmopsis bovis]|nr:hypothetical protein [Mycoplasmopsis bovis]WHO16703.1 hypothetical protein HYD65_04350 [Mycoplasmopsis bovis]WNA90965.1 hypothetical protein HYE45_04105 [Mycoplasmopsis bovis]